MSPVPLFSIVSAFGYSGTLSHVLTIIAAIERAVTLAAATFAIATALAMLLSFTVFWLLLSPSTNDNAQKKTREES